MTLCHGVQVHTIVVDDPVIVVLFCVGVGSEAEDVMVNATATLSVLFSISVSVPILLTISTLFTRTSCQSSNQLVAT